MTKATSALDQETIIKKALVELRETKARLGAIEAKETEPIAIIGIGCRFPGNVHNPDTFWKLLHHGIDAITEVPADRWNINQYYDPNPDAPGKIYSRHGGFVDHLKDFDAAFFGISPREGHSLDPQQRLLLEVSWEALESADVNPHVLSRLSTGVFIGICSNDYTQHLIAHGEDRIDAYFATGNAHSTAAGRLSFLLGLTGPSLAVDTACSSSLVALHLACSSLRNRESDVALAGGVNRLLSPVNSINFCKARMLAADGRCKTFDISADGFVRSEGCGMVVLKRLSDAQRDGDNIMALIRGSAINQDGHTSGLTVPNGPSQQAVIRQALQAARVNPVQVSYVEAHGTGTSLGDPLEVGALGAVFGPHHSEVRPLAIGSVKTNIGHLEAAAGIAGLIKVVLQLQHQEIAPHLHLRQPNPYIDWESWPVKIPTQPLPWTGGEEPRIAGVSSFGFSGTNAHVIVQEAPAPVFPPAEVERPLHLLALSAQSQSALRQLTQEYEGYLKEHPEVELADVCFSSNIGRVHFDERLALVGGNRRELLEQLKAWQLGEITPPVSPIRGDIGILFTGQGSQYVGMGQQLYETQPAFRKTLSHCAEILNSILDKPLESIIYPREGEDSSLLDQTAYTQPALFALEYALYQMWRSWGIQPAAVMGHSVGEYVAACVAGVFSLEDGLKLISTRGKLMQQLQTGGVMVSLMASSERVKEAIASRAEVAIAAINGPQSTVISGVKEAVQAVISHLEAEGIKSKPLQVSHAFHSPLMQSMLAEFEQVARQVSYSEPSIELISNVTGKVATAEVTTPEYWCQHILEPVNFVAGMEMLHQLGCEVFLECGPKPILLSLGQQCLPENVGVWLPSLRPGLDDWQQMLTSLGDLYVRGVKVDWQGFDRDYPQRRKVTLPTYPFQRQRYWVETSSHNRYMPKSASAKLHPLIAQKFQSPLSKDVFFESHFSTEVLPFLADHQVFKHVVVPGACHLSLLLEVASLTFPEEGCQLADIVFPQALAISESQARTVQAILTPQRDTLSFQIISFEANPAQKSGIPQTKTYALHATGTLVPWQGTPIWVSLQEIQNRCPTVVEGATIYQNIARRQIQLGEHFRWIDTAWVGNGEVLGRLKRPAAIQDAAYYQLYPSLIDAFFQLVAAVEMAESTETWVPFQLQRFSYVRRPQGEELWCHSQWRQDEASGAKMLVWDMQVFDTSGQVIARIESFETRKVSQEVLLKTLDKDLQNGLYEVEWRSKARFGRLEPPDFIPTPPQIATHLQPDVQEMLVENKKLHQYIQNLVPQLEQVSLSFILQALTQLGWSYQVGESLDLAGVAQQLGVVPQHQRLLVRLLQILSSEGILKPHQGQWQVLQPLPSHEDLTLQNSPALSRSAEWQILNRCGSQLSAVLRGAVDPMELVFPAGDLSTATQLYQDSPGAQVFNRLVQQAVTTAVAGAPQQRGLRVLEIGAGTGGTTSYLLPHLPEKQTQYCFTDLGLLFAQKAQERFGEYNFLEYRTLDIEQEPSAQGFGTQSQDVVIAANALYATQNIRQTLANVRQLLAPGGLLVLLEATHRQRWVDLIFGLLEEWWRFADVELRSDYPLLDRVQWQQVLQESGFSSVAVRPGTEAGDDLGQAVIVAQVSGSSSSQLSSSRGWLLLADQQGVAQQVAERLREQKEVCTLVKIGPRTQLEDSVVLSLEPDDAEGYQQLLSVVKERMPEVQGVIHCWGLDGPAPLQMDSRALEVASRLGCGTVLSLVQGLVTSSGEGSPRLWIVTRGAQPAAGKDRVNLSGVSQSSLWGMGKVIAQEHPELRCTCIDLDANASVSSQAASLWAEVWSGDREDQVALRQDERYVARLVGSEEFFVTSAQSSASMPDEPEGLELSARGLHGAEVRLPGEGTYLITGGLGGLGLLVANWLVEHQVTDLVLIGRREPSEEALPQLQVLEEKGAKVLVAIADVSDYGAMAEVINSIGQSHPPLRGIIHAAGVLDDGTLLQLSWQKFATVMGPKVQGAWNLHQLTSRAPVEFFVLFSSAASMLGSPGQGNYSAANAFLDGLAYYRQSLGLPGQSLNLGAVTQVGQAAERGVDARVQRQGMGAIAPQQVLDVLDRLLHQRDVAQVGLVPINWSHEQLPQGWLDWPYLSDWTTGDRKAKEVATESDFVQQLRAASAQEQKKMLTALVRRQVAQVLGIADWQGIGEETGFFELGMDSLMAVELRNQLQKQLGVDVPISQLMDEANISNLEEAISQQLEQSLRSIGSSIDWPTIAPAPEALNVPFPLNEIQQAYWLGRNALFELGNVATHVYFEIDCHGLDLSRLNQVWQRLIDHHPMLKAIILSDGTQQILLEVPSYEIALTDLSAEDAASQLQQLSRIRDELSHQILPANQWPLFELRATKLGAEQTRLHLSFDFLIADAASLQMLLQQWIDLYHHPDQALSPSSLSFRDYVLAEQAIHASEWYQQAERYWFARLDRLPAAPELPLALHPSQIQRPRFGQRSYRLAPDHWRALQARGQQAGLTPSGVLLAAFSEVLSLWSRRSHFTLNLTLFNRFPLHPDINEIVGDFTLLTLLEVDFRSRLPFSERARALQKQLFEDLDRRQCGGIRVLRELGRRRGNNRQAAAMPVVFTSTLGLTQAGESSAMDAIRQLGEIVYTISQTPQVWLDHQVFEEQGALVFYWHVVESLFPAGLVDDMFATYCHWLEQLATDETVWQQVRREQLLPMAQQQQRARVNATAVPMSEALLHGLFADQLPERTQQPAVITPDRCLTYGELAQLAQLLAHQLRQQGAMPNKLVAVVLSKGWRQVVAVMGVLMSGAAYVPIDPQLPTQRQQQLLEQSQAHLAIADAALGSALGGSSERPVLVLDEAIAQLRENLPPLRWVQQPEDLAYVIYTSGSTGLPKGVAISHRGAVNTICDINERFGVGVGDRVLALSELNFDLSVYDIFGILAAGGTVVIPAGDDRRRDPAHWVQLMSTNQVTLWNSVPAFMQMLVEYLSRQPEKVPSSLRLILLSGDWLPMELPELIKALWSKAEVVSLGGATEASIWSILYRIEKVDPNWKSIPYGKPMKNQQFHVLSELLEPAPVWVPGQLYIGGMGLATGYWLDEEKTRSSFITHPVTKERLYKTGDLGRYLPSGNIEFLGREDFQVKVNGYRIELGEIEITLKQHPAVKEAVVTAVGPERGNKQLVAYVVSHQDGSKTAEAHNPRELEGVILDPVARMEFRLKQPGLRQSLTTQSTIDLALPEFDEGLRRAYLERQSYRQFQTRPISFEQFSQFLSCLLSRQLEDYPLPKYQFPSAGSLYPVQTYLFIKPNRIEGVEAGIYYYHPIDHRLVLLSSTGIKSDVYHGNEAIYEQSAFSLLLIGEMKAISPMYGERARDFCLLEAGHIGQLLMKAAPQQEIGLCPIGAMEFSEMRQQFKLESSQVLLYSFLGGKIDVEQTKSWFSSQNGREAISVTLRKYLMQKLPEYMVPTFVLLDALPLTPNGKVDRRALPSPVASRRPELAISDVMPRTESEKIIAGVWQDVLKLEKVGIHANFFDLGGNSLVLVQVRNQLQDIMKRELSIVDLFTFPTIQELAQHLSPEQDLPPGEDETQDPEGNSTVHPVRKTAPTVPECLVPLQSEGDRLPFFCVHPTAGVVFPYVELARILGDNQPFYGLQSLGLNPGETPLTSISDMAAAYVAAIKTVQPQGPYRVGGWSTGALSAFEMARQLQQAGEIVDRLVLIDQPAPLASSVKKAIANMSFPFQDLLPEIWPYVSDYLRLHWQGDNTGKPTSPDRPKLPSAIVQRMKKLSSLSASIRPLAAVIQANTQAFLSYTPNSYDGEITLLRTYRSLGGDRAQELTLGWQQFSTQTVQVHFLPGRHLTLLRSPHVQQLAEVLQSCLQEPQ